MSLLSTYQADMERRLRHALRQRWQSWAEASEAGMRFMNRCVDRCAKDALAAGLSVEEYRAIVAAEEQAEKEAQG